MKKLSLFALAALLIFAVGCNSDAEEHYFGEYSDLKPGMLIYNAVSTQQLVAMDPTAVALRLAMLLDEAALKGADPDEVEIRIGERNLLLKDLLFGRSVKIEEVALEESPEEGSGLYRITYTNAAPATVDSYRREGSYLIHTQGLSLTESSEQQPWRVTPEEQLYLYMGAGDSERFILKGGTTELYASDSGVYAIRLRESGASFEVTEQFTSAWSGDFTLTTSTITGDLAYSNHRKDTYNFWGEAEGPTFYAFNNASRTRMYYRIDEANRMSWQPSVSGSNVLAVSGVEYCRLTHAEDYPAEIYPAPDVSVSRTYSEGKVTHTLTYNGLKMEF